MIACVKSFPFGPKIAILSGLIPFTSDQDSVKGRNCFQNKFTIIQTSQQMNSYCVRKTDVWLLAFPFECILPYDFNADLIKVTPYRISLMLIIRSRIFVKLFSHRGMMHYWVTTSDSMMFFPFLASSVVAPFLSSLLCQKCHFDSGKVGA